MFKQARVILFNLPVVITVLGLHACTNDLKKIREISAKQINSPADTTRGVDVIFSDSAQVQAHITTPLLLEYPFNKDNKESYKLMPKGVKVTLYDKKLLPTGDIIADTAYYYESQQLIKFIKNVVLTTRKGDTATFSQLSLDRLHHRLWSAAPFDFRLANGNHGHATSLETNEKLSPLNTQNQTGLLYIDPKYGH